MTGGNDGLFSVSNLFFYRLRVPHLFLHNSRYRFDSVTPIDDMPGIGIC